MSIDLNDLNAPSFLVGELYGLEMAVDHGDENGRDKQERWNDQANALFHKNPMLWGEMYIVPPEQARN